MPGKPYPRDLLHQAISALNAWSQIDDQMTFGPLNTSTLAEDLNQARGIEDQLIGLANQLTDLRNQRDAVHQSIWDKLKRIRSGMKASFGDDSSQYEMVGGTRMSERKSTRRRTATPA
jgi:hypothetical protein